MFTYFSDTDRQILFSNSPSCFLLPFFLPWQAAQAEADGDLDLALSLGVPQLNVRYACICIYHITINFVMHTCVYKLSNHYAFLFILSNNCSVLFHHYHSYDPSRSTWEPFLSSPMLILTLSLTCATNSHIHLHLYQSFLSSLLLSPILILSLSSTTSSPSLLHFDHSFPLFHHSFLSSPSLPPLILIFPLTSTTHSSVTSHRRYHPNSKARSVNSCIRRSESSTSTHSSWVTSWGRWGKWSAHVIRVCMCMYVSLYVYACVCVCCEVRSLAISCLSHNDAYLQWISTLDNTHLYYPSTLKHTHFHLTVT